uniref:Uncharacterized protein n=1 Tax=Octopus bimaculoides TaxID=37653 RepID=A0A0L8FKV4_OCTBM
MRSPFLIHMVVNACAWCTGIIRVVIIGVLGFVYFTSVSLWCHTLLSHTIIIIIIIIDRKTEVTGSLILKIETIAIIVCELGMIKKNKQKIHNKYM